jgi:2,3,4,5-tetrahydropyridine-2-carboxylate N-succinyltransferase
VGSCAQIVKRSSGVGIGGVLEPLQATPVIIEDGALVPLYQLRSACRERSSSWCQCLSDCIHKIIDVTGENPVEMKGFVRVL